MKKTFTGNPINKDTKSTKKVKQNFIKHLKNVSLSEWKIICMPALFSFNADVLCDKQLKNVLDYLAEQLALTTETQIQLALGEICGLFTKNELSGLTISVKGFMFNSDNNPNKSTKALLKFLVIENETYDHISKLYEFDSDQILQKLEMLTEFQAFSIFMAGNDGLLLPYDEIT